VTPVEFEQEVEEIKAFLDFLNDDESDFATIAAIEELHGVSF
jgi:hypothetical protein